MPHGSTPRSRQTEVHLGRYVRKRLSGVSASEERLFRHDAHLHRTLLHTSFQLPVLVVCLQFCFFFVCRAVDMNGVESSLSRVWRPPTFSQCRQDEMQCFGKCSVLARSGQNQHGRRGDTLWTNFFRSSRWNSQAAYHTAMLNSSNMECTCTYPYDNAKTAWAHRRALEGIVEDHCVFVHTLVTAGKCLRK